MYLLFEIVTLYYLKPHTTLSPNMAGVPTIHDSVQYFKGCRTYAEVLHFHECEVGKRKKGIDIARTKWISLSLAANTTHNTQYLVQSCFDFNLQNQLRVSETNTHQNPIHIHKLTQIIENDRLFPQVRGRPSVWEWILLQGRPQWRRILLLRLFDGCWRKFCWPILRIRGSNGM